MAESLTHEYSSSNQLRSICMLLVQEGSHMKMKAPKRKLGFINKGST